MITPSYWWVLRVCDAPHSEKLDDGEGERCTVEEEGGVRDGEKERKREMMRGGKRKRGEERET